MALLALAVMLQASLLFAQSLDPDVAKGAARLPLSADMSADLTKRLVGSWKISGYRLWDKTQYREIAIHKEKIDETLESFLFRPDGTFRHIMSEKLFFTGRYRVREGVGVGAPPAKGGSSPARLVVVALDISATMRGEPIEAARDTLAKLVAELAGDTEIRLVVFGDKVTRRGTPGGRTAGSLEARDQQTQLFDGVLEALQVVREEQAAMGGEVDASVVVISDGKDEGSSHDFAHTLARIETAGVPVHAVALTRIDRAYLSVLRAFARASKGELVEVESAGALGDGLRGAVKPAGAGMASGEWFLLETYDLTGPFPGFDRKVDWFVGTFRDSDRELLLFYSGEKLDVARAMRQGHSFDPADYGSR